MNDGKSARSFECDKEDAELIATSDLLTIKPIHARFVTDRGTEAEHVCEGDYIFGAVCNSRSVAGILKLDKQDIDMNDGKMEVFLVRMPKDLLDLNEIAVNMLNGTLRAHQIDFFSAEKVEVDIEEGTHWTLDGEYEEGAPHCSIATMESAISFIR